MINGIHMDLYTMLLKSKHFPLHTLKGSVKRVIDFYVKIDICWAWSELNTILDKLTLLFSH